MARGSGLKNHRTAREAAITILPSYTMLVQIYNEQVGDLFCSGGSGHGLRVREHPTKGAFVEGLSARPVTCYQQVQQLLEDGMLSRWGGDAMLIVICTWCETCAKYLRATN